MNVTTGDDCGLDEVLAGPLLGVPDHFAANVIGGAACPGPFSKRRSRRRHAVGASSNP